MLHRLRGWPPRWIDAVKYWFPRIWFLVNGRLQTFAGIAPGFKFLRTTAREVGPFKQRVDANIDIKWLALGTHNTGGGRNRAGIGAPQSLFLQTGRLFSLTLAKYLN